MYGHSASLSRHIHHVTYASLSVLTTIIYLLSLFRLTCFVTLLLDRRPGEESRDGIGGGHDPGDQAH